MRYCSIKSILILVKKKIHFFEHFLNGIKTITACLARYRIIIILDSKLNEECIGGFTITRVLFFSMFVNTFLT